MSDDIEDTWLKPREAAALIGVTSRTIVNWCNDGRLHVMLTPGGHRLVSKLSLLSVCPTGVQVPAPAPARATARRIKLAPAAPAAPAAAAPAPVPAPAPKPAAPAPKPKPTPAPAPAPAPAPIPMSTPGPTAHDMRDGFILHVVIPQDLDTELDVAGDYDVYETRVAWEVWCKAVAWGRKQR